MLIKILFVAGLIFLVGRNLMKLVDASSPEKKKPKKKDDDVIDADYTVIDDDK